MKSIRLIFCLTLASVAFAVPLALAAPPHGEDQSGALTKSEASRRDSVEHYLRGKLLAGDGEYTEALKELRKAVDLEPDDGHLRREYAEALRDVQILPEAETQARKAVALIPNNAAAHRALGQILLAAGKDKAVLEEAASELKKANDAMPLDPVCAASLAQALLRLDRPAEAVTVLERILEKGRGSSIPYLYGEALERTGRFGEAEDVYQFLLRQDPDNPAVTFALLRVYEKSRQIDKAALLVDSFLRKHPNNVGLKTQYGLLLVRARRFSDAEKVLSEVLKADPQNRDALRHYAALLAETNRPDEAGEVLKKLQGLDPDDPDVPFRRAMFLLEARKIGEAEKILKELRAGLVTRKAGPEGLAQVDGQLANAAYLRKDYRAARALVAPYLEESGPAGANPQAFDLLMQIARDENDYAEGLRIARKAMKAGNPSPLVRSSLAEFLLKSKQAGEVEEGEKILADLAEQDRPGALLAADTWQRIERFGRAAAVAKAALEKYPEDPDLLFRLGASLERDQRGAEAVGVFERLLKVKPEHAASLNYLGYYWADRGENLEKARSMIQKAVDLDPGNGAYLDSLGWVLYQLDRPDEAEKYLKEAASLTPDDPTIMEHLGDVAVKKGDVAKARELWGKALTMKPEDGGKKLEEKLRKAEGGGPAPR